MITFMNESATPRSRPALYQSSRGQVVFPRQRSLAQRLLRWLAVLACLGAVAGTIAVSVVLVEIGRTPRDRPSSGHPHRG